MTRDEFIQIFDRYDHEFLKKERVDFTVTKRPDLHAFLLLDRLLPGKRDMISASEHDEYFLDIDIDKLVEVITEADIITLQRCGVRYDESLDSLAVFA